jgi:hypothetical protein
MDPDTATHELKERYDFAAWAGRASGPVRFVLDPHELPNSRLRERSAIPGGADHIDHLEHDQPGAHVAVTVSVRASALDAQQGLLGILATSMLPRLPSCAEAGMEIGDACFCSTGEPIDRVWFTRANVLVRVESVGEQPVSVLDIAAAVDRQIREAPSA